MARFERLGDVTNLLGESPFWAADGQALWWIDWTAQTVLRLDWASGAVGEWPAGEPIGCLVCAAGGGAVLATASGFHHFDPATGRKRLIADPDPDPETLLNDGKCDRAGRFWCGDMDVDGTRARGRIHRLDPDGATATLGPAVTMLNGMAWSPDDSTIYFADSGTREIYAAPFDLATGSMGEAKSIAAVEPPGVPDGATIDAEGFLWWTEFDNGRLRRYAPDGRVERTIDLPVSQPTSCIFGGPRLDRLIVTTARHGFDEARCRAEPLAGAVLALEVGVAGRPEPVYGEPPARRTTADAGSTDR